MSVRQFSDRSATKLETLRTELVYLYELRIRHTQWMNETDAEDYETYRLHREIVDLMKPVSQRFQSLLEKLQEEIK